MKKADFFKKHPSFEHKMGIILEGNTFKSCIVDSEFYGIDDIHETQLDKKNVQKIIDKIKLIRKRMLDDDFYLIKVEDLESIIKRLDLE